MTVAKVSTTQLRGDIVEILRERRANYTDFAAVSDGTIDALSAWVMDVVGPALDAAYEQGKADWNDYLRRFAENLRD